MVAAAEHGPPPVSFDDPALRRLRIGLPLVGAEGANTPPVQALARRGIVTNVEGFSMWDEASVANPPAKIIDAVADGEIDLAYVWGPIAGYLFAQRHPGQVTVTPIAGDPEQPSLPFSYDMAVGVRQADSALLVAIDAAFAHRAADIRAILADYGVPLTEAADAARP